MRNKEIKYDVIIVLGGGIDAAGNLSQKSKDRLTKAVELFRNGAASNIIICGGWPLNLSQKPAVTEASAMKNLAISLGIPAGKIFIEEQSRDTIGNACHAKTNFLQPNSWQSILLVTSNSHTGRAKYLFSRILGNAYQIDTFAVAEIFSFYNSYYEFVAKITARHLLQNIAPGDDAPILRIVSSPDFAQSCQWHPVMSFLRALNFINLQIGPILPRQ